MGGNSGKKEFARSAVAVHDGSDSGFPEGDRFERVRRNPLQTNGIVSAQPNIKHVLTMILVGIIRPLGHDSQP